MYAPKGLYTRNIGLGSILGLVIVLRSWVGHFSLSVPGLSPPGGINSYQSTVEKTQQNIGHGTEGVNHDGLASYPGRGATLLVASHKGKLITSS